MEGRADQTGAGGHRVGREVTRLYYDGLGRRLVKEYDPKDGGGGVKRTEYTFDNLDPVAEYSLWNGQREEFYRGGLEALSPTPMLLAMGHFPEGTPGQTYWVHLDGRGSVAGLTKHLGQSTHNYRYDAYGRVLPAQGNFTDPHNHYTLLGKEWDEHLGLYEFGVRLYDPWAGVWLTREPLAGDAWRPRTWHRYAYAFANPVSYYDPYGLAVTPGDGGGPLPPTPTPPTPAPMPPSLPTGANPCALPEHLQNYARSAGREFGLPPEFVLAVLWAQKRYDYDLQDLLEDLLAQSALEMIAAQETLPAWARVFSGPYGGEGWAILWGIERLDLSLGVSQIRLSSAREAAAQAVRTGLEGYDPGIPTRELVERLEDPEWNIRYMAGYLRLLADRRNTQTFTIPEMQILYGAYRVGPETEVAPKMEAINLPKPGQLGSLLAPECIEYYRKCK